MCGIVGIVAKGSVNQSLYDALTVLQHRGQDAAGIVTCDNRVLHLRKDNGLVRDVFHARHMQRLRGNVGIGHVRYPTAGSANAAEAQPFYTNAPYGITLCHNGNLINAEQLKREVFLFELDAEAALSSAAPTAKPVSKFPSIRRDIAVVVDDKISADELVRAVESTAPDLISNVRIFDS